MLYFWGQREREIERAREAERQKESEEERVFLFFHANIGFSVKSKPESDMMHLSDEGESDC